MWTGHVSYANAFAALAGWTARHVVSHTLPLHHRLALMLMTHRDVCCEQCVYTRLRLISLAYRYDTCGCKCDLVMWLLSLCVMSVGANMGLSANVRWMWFCASGRVGMCHRVWSWVRVIFVEMKMVVSGRQIKMNQRHDDKLCWLGAWNCAWKLYGLFERI